MVCVISLLIRGQSWEALCESAVSLCWGFSLGYIGGRRCDESGVGAQWSSFHLDQLEQQTVVIYLHIYISFYCHITCHGGSQPVWLFSRGLVQPFKNILLEVISLSYNSFMKSFENMRANIALKGSAISSHHDWIFRLFVSTAYDNNSSMDSRWRWKYIPTKYI